MYVSIRPMCFSAQLMIENCESKIHQNAIAESAVGTMKGRSTMARKNALNGRCLLRINASHSPSANLMTLATNV